MNAVTTLITLAETDQGKAMVVDIRPGATHDAVQEALETWHKRWGDKADPRWPHWARVGLMALVEAGAEITVKLPVGP